MQDPSDGRAILEIRILSFSTGQPHPLAEQPIVFIDEKALPLGTCSVEIKIVGDFLILLITFSEWSRNRDLFFLVRWRKGLMNCVSIVITANSFTIADTLRPAWIS